MKRRRKKQNIQRSYICKIFGLIVAITVIAVSGGILLKRTIMESPEDTLVEYMNHIEKKEYEVMYTMIDSDEKVYLTKEEYIQRNSKQARPGAAALAGGRGYGGNHQGGGAANFRR